ncbi:hypothetical protein BWP39_08990 [Paraburkholderia acidicola]|uniref:Secreted protein n=1 Tax=Paraburkholderia acidicola TaxID=1912599 RepID=A0A2A4EZ65_9BURK|nr:hypothetical protein [Paraburkholderia acidicola]PCE26913.1 hypothetical protein BWP39_08990 [Paraburkholderia acidicola]
MKPMSLLLCGIVVSSIVAIAAAQERPSSWGAKDGRTPAAQRSNAQQKEFTPPAPRGDLRGDIASNAHTRPDPPARNARNNTLPRQ